MTLEEFKTKVFSIIEEYDEKAPDLTNDTDLASKMNHAINLVLHEVSRFKKIPAYTKMEIEFEEGENEFELELKDIDKMIYQINVIRGPENILLGDTVIFYEEGTAKISYFKYPEPITEETDDEFVLELDPDALECAVMGVAADILKADVSNQYGQIYETRYQNLLSRLDERRALGGIYLEGGIEI